MQGAEHLHDYLELLSSPRYQSVVESHGLVMLEDPTYLHETIENAVAEIIAK
jgi:hypothetical protein